MFSKNYKNSHYLKQKISLSVLLLIHLFSFGQNKIEKGFHTFTITNCGNESRLVIPMTTVRGIKYLVYGSAEFRKMKTLHFSKNANLDTSRFLKNIDKLKSTLPKNYFGGLSGYEFSNEPNENFIWITNIFGEILESGKIKIFSAYKMTFEGNDPTALAFRSEAKISNIDFIFDLKQKIELEKELKRLSKNAIK